MHRICLSLHNIGYEVILVGRLKAGSKNILFFPFEQRRLYCFFENGFMFYAEYHVKLFFFLLFRKLDIIYAVDLDTIAVGGLLKLLRRKKLVYDAHEYFVETPELHQRPIVKGFWNFIGNVFVPKADQFITVNESLAKLLGSLYDRSFTYVYNTPRYSESMNAESFQAVVPYLLYQGVLNKGRGIEEMISAMELIDNVDFYIVGDGDLSSELKILAAQSLARDRIKFLGWLSPDEMKKYTIGAILGINLLDGSCENYFYSLANKFFDYMHMGIPSINMDFPEYRSIIDKYKIGLLIPELSVESISREINNVLSNIDQLIEMQENCVNASRELNWQNEEKKLFQSLGSLYF